MEMNIKTFITSPHDNGSTYHIFVEYNSTRNRGLHIIAAFGKNHHDNSEMYSEVVVAELFPHSNKKGLASAIPNYLDLSVIEDEVKEIVSNALEECGYNEAHAEYALEDMNE